MVSRHPKLQFAPDSDGRASCDGFKRLPIYEFCSQAKKLFALSPQIIALNPQILERGHSLHLGIVPSPGCELGFDAPLCCQFPAKLQHFPDAGNEDITV